MERKFDGYTGHLFEERVLGRCTVMWRRGYLSWKTSLRLAKQHQPKVKCSRAAALQSAVSDKIGGHVRFYTTVGTPMDFFHGVDAIFEFEGYVVTIDLTLNSSKDVGKADIVFNPNEANWDELVRWITAEFATQRRRNGDAWHA